MYSQRQLQTHSEYKIHLDIDITGAFDYEVQKESQNNRVDELKEMLVKEMEKL